jgi:hypothetical protein
MRIRIPGLSKNRFAGAKIRNFAPKRMNPEHCVMYLFCHSTTLCGFWRNRTELRRRGRRSIRSSNLHSQQAITFLEEVGKKMLLVEDLA